MVVLGYRSAASTAATVPAGSGANALTVGVADRGQPSTFEPGEHHGVWLVTVDAAAEPGIAWRLGTTDVGFDGAPECTTATAVTVSAPAQVSAGGQASVSATVTRMLLGAPDAGTVAFALDGGAAVAVPVSAGVARADLPVPAVGPHTVTATFQPAAGSGLLSAVGTTTLTATAASAPLGIAANSVVAGSTGVLVTVTRPSPAGTATVDVMTADGTATAGTDYGRVSTVVAFADGQASATVSVPLLSRPAGAPAATFFVLLQRASTAVSTASATVRLPAVPATPPAAVTAVANHPRSVPHRSVPRRAVPHRADRSRTSGSGAAPCPRTQTLPPLLTARPSARTVRVALGVRPPGRCCRGTRARTGPPTALCRGPDGPEDQAGGRPGSSAVVSTDRR